MFYCLFGCYYRIWNWPIVERDDAIVLAAVLHVKRTVLEIKYLKRVQFHWKENYRCSSKVHCLDSASATEDWLLAYIWLTSNNLIQHSSLRVTCSKRRVKLPVVICWLLGLRSLSSDSRCFTCSIPGHDLETAVLAAPQSQSLELLYDHFVYVSNWFGI